MDMELADKYIYISRIGRGAYGSVVKAKEIKTNKIVAIKQISLRLAGDTRAQSNLSVFREISALRHSNHANIVSLLEVHFQPYSVSLVLENVESTLKLVIADVRKPINTAISRHYFRQLFYGLAYLHHLGIMHRDIKPDNILISANNEVRIADFGLACLHFPTDPTRQYENQVCTRWYRAPELLFGSTQYTPSVDIWAAGCIVAEYLNGEPLFAGKNDIDQIVRVFRVLGTPTKQTWPDWERLPDQGKVLFEQLDAADDWTKVVPQATAECLELLTAMLRLDYRRRPEAKDCLLFDFFRRHQTLVAFQYKPPSLEEARKQAEEDELVYNLGSDDAFHKQISSSSRWDFQQKLAEEKSDSDVSTTPAQQH